MSLQEKLLKLLDSRAFRVVLYLAFLAFAFSWLNSEAYRLADRAYRFAGVIDEAELCYRQVEAQDFFVRHSSLAPACDTKVGALVFSDWRNDFGNPLNLTPFFG